MTQPRSQKKTDWSAAFSKPETAPRSLEAVPDEETETTTPTTAAAAKSPRQGKPRGPYNVKKVDKKPATFRLPPDVLELIDNAREEAAESGVRLTKDDAVTAAIRHYYGGSRRRR
ncbi:hypothetical protein G3N18_02155 [Microbacterium sp. 2C]|uniref:hypothetical protein n=1 Tax=Microbacterium paulum TaxID=2707006 RepID=UPI0018C29E6C|nr:hypothetical protein [Microbacterium paulum]MBG0716891.1 hypothetical protein [Microbacterium paulum]